MDNQEKSRAENYREERKKRIAKANKRNAKGSMSERTQKTIVYVIMAMIAVLIIGAIAGGIVDNKGILERNKTIMTIGEDKIDKYEYAYYYSNMMMQYFNQAYQLEMSYGQGMGAMTGYDYSKAPSEQAYTFGEIEGIEDPTFADFLKNTTVDNLKYVKACLAYAKENNITLDDSDRKVIEDNFKQIEESLTNEDGSKMSIGLYLRNQYGKGMTESLYRRILEENAIAQKVMEVKSEELAASYEDAKVEETFNEQIDTYGVVTMRNYVIKAETVASGEDEEATEAPTEETLAAAKEKAEAFVAGLTDEESFKKAAAELEKAAGNEKYEDFLKDDSMTLLADSKLSEFVEEDFTKWLKSAKAGETYILESDTGYTVYLMVEGVHKAPEAAETYDVRHILVKFPEDNQEEVTDGDAKPEEAAEIKTLDFSKYDATVDIDVDTATTANPEYYNKALDILEKYLEGDKSEDAFAALAKEYSEDGNAEDGGIYEEVPLGQMVAPFEDWSTDLERKAGDVGIVETTYGYHVMYFVKNEIATWDSTIRNDLASADYVTFREELIANEALAPKEADEAMVSEIVALVDETAKNMYNYYSQQSAYNYF